MRARDAYPIGKTTLRLLRQMGPWKQLFIPGVLMTSGIYLAFSLLLAGFYGDAAAAILAGESRQLAVLSLYYALPLAGILAFSSIARYMTRTAVAEATADLRSRAIRQLLAAPLDSGLADHSGIKTSLLINDVPAAMECLNRVMSRPLESLVRGIGSFLYVAWLDERIALAALAFSFLGLVYSVPFAYAMRRAGNRVQEAMAQSTRRLKDLLGGVVVARTYGTGDSMRESFEAQVETAKREGLKRARISAALAMFNNGYSGLGDAAILLVAGSLALAGRHDVPTFVRLVQMTPGILHMFSMSRALSELMGSLSGAQRVFEVLDRPVEGSLSSNLPVPDAVPGAPVIRFDRMVFGHDPHRPVLRGVSFHVDDGEMVAIVGESGNGKSTLLRMLQGMYLPDEGDVEVYGVSTARWPLAALRNKMALVPQEAGLVSGTILENIGLGREEASTAQVLQAAALSGADTFIRRLPQGYDSQTGERGGTLSGGQRQRIAIARALVKDAPILLLDEATSSLDARAELTVRQSVRNLRSGRTLIVVAHRLATVRDADRILVLMDGHIAEQGKHEDLLRLGGEYARLYTRQQKTNLIG